ETTKEIYFISDGDPTEDHEGDQIATSLKKSGVSIATIMLDGDDRVMADRIASRDATGKPLHTFVRRSEQLAQALEEISKNGIESAKVKYRFFSEDGLGEWE